MSNSRHQSLRQQLPNIPRWIDTRSLLNDTSNDLLQDLEQSQTSFVIYDDEDEFGSIVGTPSAALIAEAAAECEEMLAFPENIDYVKSVLPEWAAEPAAVHIAGPDSKFPPAPSNTRLLAEGELTTLKHLSAALAEELGEVEKEPKPIAVACDEGLPVAFCYPTCHSETHWDISIDTISSHRGRGFAAQATLKMIEQQRQLGLEPIWAAVASNIASLRVAAKLGFQQVDTIWLLTEPE